MMLPPEGQELVRRAAALVPQLAADAEEAERLRRPTDAQMRALEEAGLFRLMVPRAYGGLELDLDSFLEVGLALARADMSIAWVTTFLIEHNWMLCQFPEAFQKELYAGPDWILAPGIISPTGKALPEEGGYRLNGRWSWATGMSHSTWAILGSLSDASPGADSVRFMAVPMSELRVDDVWHTAGMRATASNDLVAQDLFVPEGRSVSVPDMVNGVAHGARVHAGPLYRTPMLPILMLAASMPIVGGAVAAAERFAETLRGKMRMNRPGQNVAERPGAQMRLGAAHLEAASAERALRSVVPEVMARRNQASRDERIRWSATITHAVHQARRVIQDVAEASGGSAQFLSHPHQRALRDAQVASSHVAFDHDLQREIYGKVLLGIEPEGGLF